MNSNVDFAECVQVVPAFLPVNMAGSANTGDWISLKNYHRVTIMLVKAAGTAGDDPVITLQQATNVAGAGAKALAAVDKVYVKQGADLATVGTFTLVTQTASDSYTDAAAAEAQAVWLIDIQSEDLDVDGGFDCIQASVADVGTAEQLGCALYLLYPARYGQSALPSAVID